MKSWRGRKIVAATWNEKELFLADGESEKDVRRAGREKKRGGGKRGSFNFLIIIQGGGTAKDFLRRWLRGL